MREEFRVTGDKVVAKIKELVHEGNVRHIVIKNDDGKTLIEFPVTVGVAGAVLLPVWAAIGAAAAMVSKCTIEVERTDDEEEDGEGTEAAAGADQDAGGEAAGGAEGAASAEEPPVVEAEIVEE